MNRQKNTEKPDAFLKQFDDLKKKHPDALLLFRRNDFYEIYREDAVKAAAILATEITNLIIPGEKASLKMTSFPFTELDRNLPKLIRAGARVAICDALETPRQQKAGQETEHKAKANESLISNHTDMTKKKKEQGLQEEPSKTVKNAAGEKPAKEKKAKVKTEDKSEQKAESKQERKPREPQMVTANGEKVTHGHVYQSKANSEEWYFTAKMDGKQLKPQRMDAADLAAFQKKEMTVPQLMERYYPTKLLPKMPEKLFRMPQSIAGPEGRITVEKFNVYKEKDEQRPDYGKYKF